MSEKQLQTLNKTHSLTLDGRASFRLEGVEDVESFAPTQIILSTNMGRLVVKGKSLNITKLDTTGGSMQAEGVIDSMVYSPLKKKRSMASALFK